VSHRHADRWLDCFDLHAGSRYRARIHSAADTSALQQYAPRVVIQPSTALARDEAGETAAIWLISLVVALGGVAIWSLIPDA
jgi:hypothetical protein